MLYISSSSMSTGVIVGIASMPLASCLKVAVVMRIERAAAAMLFSTAAAGFPIWLKQRPSSSRRPFAGKLQKVSGNAIIASNMARTKQTARKPQTGPRRTFKDIARMTVGGGYRATPPSPKKRKSEDVDLSAEIRFLETDIAEHTSPETRPRQAPAMTRYRGVPPRAQPEAPREKKRHRRSRKKCGGPALTNPEVPAPRRRSEVTPRTQPEVIDLTGED
jgi:hypothetical protein